MKNPDLYRNHTLRRIKPGGLLEPMLINILFASDKFVGSYGTCDSQEFNFINDIHQKYNFLKFKPFKSYNVKVCKKY